MKSKKITKYADIIITGLFVFSIIQLFIMYKNEIAYEVTPAYLRYYYHIMFGFGSLYYIFIKKIITK